MRDPDRTIISQYATSPRLTQWIDSLNDCLDQRANLDAFYRLIWNVDSAQGYGLDVWGRIVGVGRVINIATPGRDLGFAGTQGSGVTTGFDVGKFYSGQNLTTNFVLTDEAYRNLILAKAAANITNCSIPAINQILQLMFPNRGVCYVQDNLNMTLTYVFHFPLQTYEVSIVTASGVLPRPAGVAALASYPTS